MTDVTDLLRNALEADGRHVAVGTDELVTRATRQGRRRQLRNRTVLSVVPVAVAGAAVALLSSPSSHGSHDLLISTTPTPSVKVLPDVPGATKVFTTPTGNISCALDATSAWCHIEKHSWPLPPRPSSCGSGSNWDSSLSVSTNGRPASAGICLNDSTGTGDVLAYGQAVRLGRVQCTSRPTEVACVVVGTPHGFSVGRSSYRVS